MSAMPDSVLGAAANDADAQETREWLDALQAVIAAEGPDRAHYLLERLIDEARQAGIDSRSRPTPRTSTPFPPTRKSDRPATSRSKSGCAPTCAGTRWRWWSRPTACTRPMAATSAGTSRRFASLATMFGTGFNHFWHAETEDHGGDLLYIQGHTSPGIYARAFMEGRISEEQLLNFRQEVDGKGISSYPHPKLMPEFWQFPTVSMGLGPLMAIYQARFLKYLHARGIANTANRKVWVFCGDGEMDEPEVARRDRPGRAREARQPDLRHQLQPAAPRRPGARQRQDHPGARRRVPRLGLERHQADVGQLLGSAARARQGRHPAQGDDGRGRRRLPGHEGQRRRLRAQELLRPPSQAARDGRPR